MLVVEHQQYPFASIVCGKINANQLSFNVWEMFDNGPFHNTRISPEFLMLVLWIICDRWDAEKFVVLINIPTNLASSACLHFPKSRASLQSPVARYTV